MNEDNRTVNQPKLIRRLGEADRTWRRAGAAEKFLRSIKFFCAAIVLFAAIDLIAQLGPLPRLLMTCSFILAAISLVFYLFLKMFPGKPSLLPVARMLEERDETLGSKLINVLQLDEKANDESLPGLTRTLARQAIEEAAEGVEGHDLVATARSRKLPSLFRRALVPVALVMIPAIYFAPISWRELLRFADPFGDHPPFSFTSLDIVIPADDDTEVVFNQPVSVEAEFSGHRPKELFLTVTSADDPDNPVTIPMFARGDDGFFQEIDQVGSDLTIRAHTKNRRSISEAREVGVILTPQLEAAGVAIQAPAYTQLKDRESRVGIGRSATPTLSVLAGSHLQFTLVSNRPLSEGSAELQSSSPESLEFKMVASDPDAPNSVLGSMVAEESGRLRFDMRDVTGLQADAELALNLIVTHDLAPEIAITEPVADGFIVDTYSTNVAVRSSDDYGLRSVRIHVGINGEYDEPHTVEMGTSPPQRASLETVKISPLEMGASAGDIISVFAEATDIRPEPQMARTRTLKLEVITEEEYNEFLRMQTEIRELEKKYANLHDELKQLAEEQRELAKEAQAAGENPDQSKRDELVAKQAQLNDKLLKLAEKMENTTRDKPLYDLENEFQEILDDEAQKVRDSVAKNQEALESFLDSPPSGESMQSFGEAGEQQADRLDPAREQAEQKIAEALEDADLMQQLLKAIGAYQELYRQQEELASQTAAYKSDPGSDSGHEAQLALQQMAGTERMIGEALEQIVENLREGADRAEEAFPEAAQDARDIADQIEGANLSNLASGAARTMLSGRGSQSHERAEHLRQEMEKLMGECSQCQGGAEGEFAMRLKLMRGMMAGDTMRQMAQCKNFGLSLGQGQGQMGGGGMGIAGMMGSGGPQMGDPMSLLGGESMLGQSAPKESTNTGKGDGDGPDSPEFAEGDEGKGEAEKIAILDRPSTSGTGDAINDEYSDVVEAYFQKLTTSKGEKK